MMSRNTISTNRKKKELNTSNQNYTICCTNKKRESCDDNN